MTTLFVLIMVQLVIGGFDNFWHHELTEKIRSNPKARNELAVHTAREWVYGVILIGLAWWQWSGWWVFVLAGLFALEIAITIIDIKVEAVTRRVPPLERWLHAALIINLAAIIVALVPVMWRWASGPTLFVPTDYGIISWLLTAAGVAAFGLAVRDTVATIDLTARQVPEWLRRPIRRSPSTQSQHVLVTGGTGTVGVALIRRLVERGDQVTLVARDAKLAAYKYGPHVRVVSDWQEIVATDYFDAVVNLAGLRPEFDLWTRSRRAWCLTDRLATTAAAVELIGRLDHTPDVLISGSSVDYYGEAKALAGGDLWCAESDMAAHDELARLAYDWEHAAREAEGFGVRVCRYRVGHVLRRDGGIMANLARAARLGLVPMFGDSQAWISWITLDDLVELMLFGLDAPRVAGPINAVAPVPVRRRELIGRVANHIGSAVGGLYGLPVVLPIPAGWLRRIGLIFGPTGAGQRALPERTTKLGFRFAAPDIDAALRGFNRPVSRKPDDVRLPLTVLYNSGCPICRSEMEHYDHRARKSSVALSFQDIQTIPTALAAYGLTRRHVEERLYVLDFGGQLLGGLDAMIAIWKRLPGYRWLGVLMAWPGVHGLGAAIYDGFLAATVLRLGRWIVARQENSQAMR